MMCKKLILLTSFVVVLSLVCTNVLFGEVIERRISTGPDDAEEAVNDGFQDTYNTSSDLEILDDDADNGGRQFIGMNFRDLGIPPGSQITNAYIEFVVDELKAGTEDDAFLLLWGHLAANTDGFADPTRNMISDRPRTEAKVPWEPEPWTAAGQVSQTSDISAIIQEIIQKRASEPSPADGAIYSDTWVSLSWTHGWASGNALEIIISEDTSKGEFIGTRTAESYNGSAGEAPLLHVEFTPGADAVVSNDVYFSDNLDDVSAGAESAFQGNQAATFLVVGFPGMPFPDGLVPGTTYYWRIDLVEPDGTTKHTGPIWSFSIPPKTAYNPDPADGAESVDVDVTLSWTGGFGAKLHTIYFGETFDEVDNAAGGFPQGTTTYSPGTLKMAKTYYWRVDEFDVVETHKGNVWSFTTEGAVSSPNPANGAVDVTQTPVLTWVPGFGASYEVYFGADALSLELKGSGNLGSESFDPGELEWDTTYYWRIDEANNANADSPWTGPLWSFTTANFLIIDDFESYNDLDPADPESNRIFNAWIDGFDDPANGSIVGNENPPFAEQTIIHSGNQSMPMSYDNAVGKSEAILTLTSNRDWTVNGVDTLTIWFRGNGGNTAEQVYVALNGNARVDNDNPDAAMISEWAEWNIDLQAFADQGVNLANVNSITLGLSSVTGGTGIMYFDDIRLHPPASTTPPEVLEGLVGLWNFDENSGDTAADSSGNGLDGTISGALWVSPGADGTGSCLDFDGLGTNRVSLGTFDVIGDGLTIACWYKADNLDTPGNDPRLFSKAIGGSGQDHWFMLSSSREGGEKVLRFRLKTDDDTGELKADTVTGIIDLDIWTHAAAVWDGAAMRLYKNGVEVGSLEKGGTLSTNPDAKVSIGNQPVDTGDRPWDGLIDDVRIYNRGLSVDEISGLAGL